MNTFKNINKAFLNMFKESRQDDQDHDRYYDYHDQIANNYIEDVVDGEDYTIEIDNHVIPVKDIDSKYKNLLKYCKDKGIKEIVLDGNVKFQLTIGIDGDAFDKGKYEYADVTGSPDHSAKYITFVLDNGQKNDAISLDDFYDVVDKTEYKEAYGDLEDILWIDDKVSNIPYMSGELEDIISDVKGQWQYERNRYNPQYYGLV